jgi:hypothetical protein
MLDEMARLAIVKLTICRWPQRRQRTGYRISKIDVKSSLRREERRKSWPEQKWHWMATPW